MIWPRPVIAVVLATMLVAVGCGTSQDDVRLDGNISSDQAEPASTATTQPPLEPAVRYQPIAGEPVPEAKQSAADVVQAITVYDVGGGTPEATVARLAALGAPPELASGAADLLDPTAASAGDIIYPQLGGLTETQASVMVVVRQRFVAPDREWQVTRTLDVRLELTDRWRVSGIASYGGAPPAEPTEVSPAARQVLDSPNISMPDSARWDIEAGMVDERILNELLYLAADHRIDVAVIASGHPLEVFDSASVSNHTEGRGVDIWGVGGQPVVSQRDPSSPLRQLTQSLVERGVEELGSPWALAGPGTFTNTVHQDHLHVAFDG